MDKINLGRAYPLVDMPQGLPPDSLLADIDITVYLGTFNPASDFFSVVDYRYDLIQLRCSHPAIHDLFVNISPLRWSSVNTDTVSLRLLAGDYQGVPLWSGEAKVEPSRVVILSGVRQTVEVYNQRRTLLDPRPGCLPYEYPEDTWSTADGYVLICGPFAGPVAITGGHSSRISQYDSSGVLDVSSDPLGGEAGRPCSGQVPYADEEIPALGRNTLDGAASCAEVLRSINGASGSSLSFRTGQGVSIYTQPEKSRVTLRFDGAGSARCPEIELNQAECPPDDDPSCGPELPVDLCPDPPEQLAPPRDAANIPPVERLPIIAPTKCQPLPSIYKYLALRSCNNAVVTWNGQSWTISRGCRSHCEIVLPENPVNADVGYQRTTQCRYVKSDTTLGVRNTDFDEQLKHWETRRDARQITSHASFSSDQLPALQLQPGAVAYQTDFQVGFRSVMKFDYSGALRVVIAYGGRLCEIVDLDSETPTSTFVGEYVIKSNQPVSVQFEVDADAENPGFVSYPHLAAV